MVYVLYFRTKKQKGKGKVWDLSKFSCEFVGGNLIFANGGKFYRKYCSDGQIDR